MPDHDYDVVVLGAGPAGEVCAGVLAQGGLEVAIVEEHLIGGECSFYACMPSKALLRPAQALAEVRRVPGAAEAVDGGPDAAAALARRDEVIHDLDDSGQLPWLEKRGIALHRGRGRLDGARRVRVGDDVLTARRAVVVATGSVTKLPPVDGLAEARPWTNREAATAGRVPRRLLVLGGGPVGAELAQAWATLGSDVTLVDPGERLLASEEPFAGEAVAEGLRDAGVDVRLGRQAERVERTDGGEVGALLDDGSRVAADELLVAAGRRPNTDHAGLETVGLEAGGAIETDEHLRALAEPSLYAIGDVNGRALLTHQGKYQARIAAQHILGRPGDGLVYGGALSPRVAFTEPQVASVGHTLQSAQDAGVRAAVAEADADATAGGSFNGRGVPARARLVVDEDRRVLVGATFTGADVAEFVHAATIAIVGEVPVDRLWHAVPAFPTRSEVWLRLLEDYEG